MHSVAAQTLLSQHHDRRALLQHSVLSVSVGILVCTEITGKVVTNLCPVGKQMGASCRQDSRFGGGMPRR